MYFDPLYWIMLAPCFLLSLYASWKVKSTFAKYSKTPSLRGETGAQVAKAILRNEGLEQISVEQTQGMLSDFYDPGHKVLKLSPEVYGESSVAALGVAAHETGHAVQDKEKYGWMTLRSALVPAANLGTMAAYPLMLLGIFMHSANLVKLGIVFFSLAVLFYFITLPVELNASSRAVVLLKKGGLITTEEEKGVRQVLQAAALTYLAAALTALVQLLYFIMRSREE